MIGASLPAAALAVTSSHWPLYAVAFFVCVALSMLIWIRHGDRSVLSTVAIGLGFGFVGLLGLIVSTTYLLALLHVPHLDSQSRLPSSIDTLRSIRADRELR